MQVNICPVCGYVQIGEIDFHFCPVCGSPAETFREDTKIEHHANWDTKSRIMIQGMAETGHYQLGGKGTTRKFLNMDDLLFMPGQIAYPPLLDDEPISSQVILGKQAGCAALQTAAPPTQPSDNTAVIALLSKAKNQSAAGRMDGASADLERALRIEPRNPVLWHELARVRLEQGQYRQAEHMAAKSNMLAGTNRYLLAENWRIIGEARSRRGDPQGAREAFDKAEQSP